MILWTRSETKLREKVGTQDEKWFEYEDSVWGEKSYKKKKKKKKKIYLKYKHKNR